MTTEKQKSIILFGKGVAALKDGVFPIADSFFDEAIRYNPEFAEAYLMKAIIVRSRLPLEVASSTELAPLQPLINKAYLLNDGLEFAISEIIKGNLNHKNVEEWLADNGKKNETVSTLTRDQVAAWENAAATDKDQRVWRKDKFGAWMKLEEFNKQTEFGWKIRYSMHTTTPAAWHWKNLTDVSGDNIGQKMKSSGDSNIESSGGCYIATVCYGSADSAEVKLLKVYRDKVLSRKILGRLFISTYYLISPRLVTFLRSNVRLNKLIKRVILDPVVNRIRTKNYR